MNLRAPFDTAQAAYEAVERNGETIWVHKAKPVWIVCYEGIETPSYIRPTYWQAYRAVEPVKRGKAVWSADNKKLAEHGFPSLEAAMVAGCAVMTETIRVNHAA